jgi:chromate reductase, NAD(P)H dehydrogenase (quinone)
MNDNGVFRILGVSGSGRKGSYNRALLRAAQELLPDGVVLETYDVSRFPLFNEDLEQELPGVIAEFKRKIKEADAMLFATPEYNYSVSAVMKNALEWGNRPEDDNSWEGKPVAIMSASSGPRGGARAQLHLRQIMVDLNMHPINQPQLLVANARESFDRNLRLIDEHSRELLRNILVALVQWAKILGNENFVVRSLGPEPGST